MESEKEPHTTKLNCVSNGREMDTKNPAAVQFFCKGQALWNLRSPLTELYMPHNISKMSTDGLELWLAHVHRPPSVAHGQILPVRATVSLSR